MNHLKIFENQNNNRFQKFIEEKTQFLQDINEYVNDLNPDICDDHIESTDIDYYFHNQDHNLEIYYVDEAGDNQIIVLKNEDALDLIEFINNTEIYRNAKKYNL